MRRERDEPEEFACDGGKVTSTSDSPPSKTTELHHLVREPLQIQHCTEQQRGRAVQFLLHPA